MPIFTAIGTAIAGALFAGSTLAASFISSALAFSASIAFSYLTRKKARPYGASAVSGEREFGARVAVSALYGVGKVKGHQIGYFKWGTGNKFNADVMVLGNGWCDGLEEYVYFYGERHDLVEADIIDNEVAHYHVDGFDDNISIRFYDGRPGQGPDTKLVADTAALGMNWKATSVCAGLCYVVVERKFKASLFERGAPDMEFVLRGLREYDPRFDSTVAGGSGPQRLNDSSTWVHTMNPAVHRLNYQIGLRGLISDRVLIGEGKTLGQLDLGSYFAAMNVCDTIREGKATYECSMYVTADDDHTEILKEFDDAMAGFGMNRRGLSGVIAGAPQTPVLEITEADVDAKRPKDVQLRKSSFELYNHISGQFTSVEAHWNPESLDPVTVNQDVADDGRPRQTSNDFLQVVDADIAQYLLQIRYRQNRKGGTATLPVSRRVGLVVQEGDWIEYLDREWMISNHRVDEDFKFTLTLSEMGADIYASGGIVPGPIVIPPTPPVNPSQLTTVQNFDVQAGFVEGPDGNQIPALRFSWTPPDDPTITAVRFEYFTGSPPPSGDVYKEQTLDPEAGEYITTSNVIGGSIYSGRATITTSPDRFKTFTPYATTDEPTPNMTVSVDLSPAQEALLQQLDVTREAALGPVIDELRGIVDQLAQDVNGMVSVMDRYIQNSIVRYIGTNNANITEVRTVADGFADLFVGIFAGDEIQSGNGLFRFTAVSAPEGVAVSFRIEIRATIQDEFAFTGFYMDAGVTELGGASRIRFVANSIYFENPTTGETRNAFLLAQQNDPIEVEIDANGDIRANISNGDLAHYTLVDDDAVVRIPTGIKPGKFFYHTLEMDDTGHAVTFDSTLVLQPHPTVSDAPGDITVLTGIGVRTSDGVRVIFGTAGAGQTVMPPQHMWNWLEELGMQSGVEFAYDIAEAACYSGSGIEINDLSGNDNHHRRGDEDDITSRYPTFNGVAGALSHNEYMSFDGDDRITPLNADDALNYADNWHKDNARWTTFHVIKFPAMGTAVEIDRTDRAIDGSNLDGLPTVQMVTLLSTNHERLDGFESDSRGLQVVCGRRIGTGNPTNEQNITLRAIVRNALNIPHTGTNQQAKLDQYWTFPSSAARWGQWNVVAVSFDESVGTDGIIFMLNGEFGTRTSTISSPSSSDPLRKEYHLGGYAAQSNDHHFVGNTWPGYGLAAGVHVSQSWSQDEMLSLYNLIKERRSGYALP